ncbi:DUF547 domain-containing protein [Aquimarina sp. AU474]|uniref:DUF547 domain-containing protein n=1 Tax=Aquimarina sp. AU474 TaxID=2108529 RepID=UPI000D68A53D|nr:DUF547 domain-containing protein [Aquimarina sp. AU474]
MKRIAIILIIFSVQLGFSQSTTDFFAKADTFFKTYVSNGRVKYNAIKKDPTSLDELLAIAAKIQVTKGKPKTFQAFYINAYNLSVIKGVVNKYPVKSPTSIKGFFDKTKYTIAGKGTTLNDLENKILRKNFPAEARFHFALVCAGLGCPPIIASAYKPSSLEQQLQKQAVKALNNPSFIKVKGKRVQLSQIFEWYKVDFTRDGTEIDYVNKFRKEKIPSNAKVSYYPYDWTLNAIK